MHRLGWAGFGFWLMGKLGCAWCLFAEPDKVLVGELMNGVLYIDGSRAVIV